jgi:2-dehydro-3-deoxygluconokinase
MIRAARVLHVSGISQGISNSACDTVFAAIDIARAAGVEISYDPNLRLKLWSLHRARAVILATLPQARFFIPSIDDARVLSGLDQPEDIARWCLDKGATGLVLKLGPAGALVADGDRLVPIPGYKVATVDATGAGDCFDGAFLSRIIAGDHIVDAARYANAAAALTTTGYGAVAPLPRPDQVRELLARGPA